MNATRFQPLPKIEVYKRKNVTEQNVLEHIVNRFPDIPIFDSDLTSSVDFAIKYAKHKNIETFLLLDAKNPNITDKGNNRKTEFYFNHKNKEYWFDAKHLTKKTNLFEIIIGDAFNQAENCPGTFVYICAGEGYNNQLDVYKTTFKRVGFENIKVVDLNDFPNFLKSL